MKVSRLGSTITGAAANLAAQAVPFLLLMIVTPILLRALGREQYGVLILLNLIPQIAGQLDLGLSTAATRGFTQHSARADDAGAHRLLREATTLLVGWGAILGIVFYLLHASIADALNFNAVVPDDSKLYWVIALSIPLSLANSAALVPLRALERYGVIARIQVVVGITFWSTCAWWAPRGGTLTEFTLLAAITVVCATIAFHFAARSNSRPQAVATDPLPNIAPGTLRDGPLPSDPVRIEGTSERLPEPLHSGWLLRPFLKLGAGAFVAQASSLATYHADKLLVSALISPAAAGGYAICTSIANKILLVVASGATFTFPRAARLHAEGESERVAATYAFATRISVLIAAALAVPLIALAPGFLSIWIAPDFAAEYGWAFRLLTLGYAITATSVVASNVAVGIGEVALPAAFALLGGTLTLVSVALLAPRYGVTGAACAAVIGMTQSLVFNDLIAKRVGPSARVASWPLVWRILVLAVPIAFVMAQTSHLVSSWPVLFALGGLALALFVGSWMFTFGREDRDLVEQLVRRVFPSAAAR